MNYTKIEEKLIDAINRHDRAQAEERYLTGQIDYHDSMASETRKHRQKERSKIDRAKVSIARLRKELLESF